MRLALSDPLQDILTTYHLADNCIPLTAYLHLLLRAGIHLNETLVRLPSVASGIGLLMLLPWAVGRAFDRLTAQHLAWLLALSPSLVFYSRIARSYMPAIFLGVAAATLFYTWWDEQNSLRSATQYVLFASSATWFHLVALPFVVAPLAYASLSLRDRIRRHRVSALLLLALALGAALSIFMLPALPSLRDVLVSKHQASHPLEVGELVCVGELLAGTGHWGVALLFWIAATAGLFLSIRRLRRVALYTLFLFLISFSAILVMAPGGYQYPVVLHRYLLFCLPPLLIWVAFALAEAGRLVVKFKARPLASIGVGLLFIAVLTAAGPLTNRQRWQSPFMHQEPWIVYCSLCRPGPASQVSPFYSGLGHATSSAPVLEYPWLPLWNLSRAFSAYQVIHGQEVVVASPRDSLWSDQFAFRNMVAPDPADLLRSRARYLVVHRNICAEEQLLVDTPFAQSDTGLAVRLMPEFKRAALGLARNLKRQWGPPDYRDDTLLVWDLRRVRLDLESDSGSEAH